MGILNGLMIAAHKKGEEKNAAFKLTELWRNIVSSDIFVQWPFPGPLRGLFNKASFFDNSPELQLVSRLYNENGGTLHRSISIGMADAQTGKFLTVNQDVGSKRIPFYVVASSSVPGIFNYVVEGNRIYIDGFTVDNLNLRGGIKECQKIVSDDSKITVDLILTNPMELPKYNKSEYSTLEAYSRAKDISSLKKKWFYLLDVMRAFPEVNFRYIVKPQKELPNFPFVPLV